jgi:hypothetical protein
MQRREAKIGLRDRKRHWRPKERNETGENPDRNGLFGVGPGIRGSVGLDGGDGRDRTANPPPSHRTGLWQPTNGIFRCRDGGAKTAFSSCGDRYRDERGLEKPTFRGTNARVSGGVRYLWTGWWRWYGSNWLPPSQSYRTASLPPALIAVISLSLRAACGSAPRPERAPSAAA